MIADQLPQKILLFWLIAAPLFHLFFILMFLLNLYKVQGKEEILLISTLSVIFKKSAT